MEELVESAKLAFSKSPDLRRMFKNSEASYISYLIDYYNNIIKNLSDADYKNYIEAQQQSLKKMLSNKEKQMRDALESNKLQNKIIENNKGQV